MNFLNCSSASNLRPNFKQLSLTVSELLSSNQNQSSEQPSLPRVKLKVRIELPSNGRPGIYEIKISKQGGQALTLERGEVTGDAKGSKILAVSIDTARLTQGEYYLGLRQGTLNWIALPLSVE